MPRKDPEGEIPVSDPSAPKLETKEQRMDLVKNYTKKVLEKYGQYIKAIVMMGSVVREEFKPKSDIDVFAIVDDTTFTLTNEMLDNIDQDLIKMADEIPEAWITVKNEHGKDEKICLISVQPVYTLTEFWDYA